jgi:hypothetical protein
MKPLNSAERTNAFLRFLLLFIITVALIITVAYFSIQVPFKENERLRQDIGRIKSERQLAESFNVAVKEVAEELNKFDGVKEPPAVTHAKIKLELDKMSGLLNNFPDAGNSVNAFIVQSLGDLNEAKLKLSAK